LPIPGSHGGSQKSFPNSNKGNFGEWESGSLGMRLVNVVHSPFYIEELKGYVGRRERRREMRKRRQANNF